MPYNKLILIECFSWFLLNSCIYSQTSFAIQSWFDKIRLQIYAWFLSTKRSLTSLKNECGDEMIVGLDIFIYINVKGNKNETTKTYVETSYVY